MKKSNNGKIAFDKGYRVSEAGDVLNINTGYILKLCCPGKVNIFPLFMIWHIDRVKSCYVHHLKDYQDGVL